MTSVAQLHIVNVLCQAVAKREDLATVFDNLTTDFAAAFAGARGRLLLLDRAQNTLAVVATLDPEGVMADAPVVHVDGPYREFLESEEPGQFPVATTAEPIHQILLPVRTEKDVCGIFEVLYPEDRVVTMEERLILGLFVRQLELALGEEVQRQVAELTTLYEAAATMTADLDRSSVRQIVVKVVADSLQVDGCAMYTWDVNRQRLGVIAYQSPSATANLGDRLSHIPAQDLSQVARKVSRSRKLRSLFADAAGSTLDPSERHILTAAGMQSILLIPLIWRNQNLGLLLLGKIEARRAFSTQEMRLARSLARQAAVAIDRADIYDKSKRRVDELAAFHQIALQLNTPLELNAVLDVITESALKLIEANNVHIFLYEPEAHQFNFGSALSRDGSRTPAVSQPRPDGITATIVRGAKPVVIADAAHHALFQSPEAAAWGIGAIAGFPLKRGSRVFGAFTLTYLAPHVFTDDELLLLNLLADQAAVAVENARLFANAQRRLREMSALVDMAQQVTGNLKVELVMTTTVNMLRELLGARASSIALLGQNRDELVIEAAAGIDPKWVHKARMRIGEGVSGKAVSERRPIYVKDTHNQPGFLFFDEILRSLIAVPLISRDEVIGALAVDSDKPNAFTESDIQLMKIAAAQVSTAIANARLFEEAEDRAARLAVAYEELKEHDRLKDELVQNVSHELRTPLTFVKGYVDLLLEGEMGPTNDDQDRTLGIVAEKTVEITRLIDDIMSLQRIDSSNLILEEFSMAQLIQDTVAGHNIGAVEKGLQLDVLWEGGEGRIIADRGRVTQVLNNLIVNAMKFSPDGGKITVTVKDEEERITVAVADQGIGMPQEKVGRIFDRFYQVDGSARRRFGGAGIGLAIVKRIVDAHQGEIWVQSEVNKGSTFRFTFPKRPGAEPAFEGSDEVHFRP